jgi:trk system potassium uptake protein TrkA
VLAQVHLAEAWLGGTARRLEEAAGVRVAFLTRLGEGVLPDAETVLQEGDLVHVVVREEHLAVAEEVFAAGPEEH